MVFKSDKKAYYIDLGPINSIVVMPFKKSESAKHFTYALRVNSSLTLFSSTSKSRTHAIFHRLLATLDQSPTTIDVDALIQ